MSGEVHELKGEQRLAVDPDECVWLSASAGTGKTQVLSARVLRLLLKRGNDPSQILCLTFTKAGAAEMAVRVNDVLARWVRMDDIQLRNELKNLGASADPETRERARSLFASVLDTPGGGLRINTIHAFAQWLLSAFPQEADIQPGSRALDDRQRDLLSREVLGDMLVAAREQGDSATLDAIAAFSLRKGPDAVRGWLMTCASASHLWYGSAAWQPPMRPRVCQLLGLNTDANAEDAAALCSDAVFDMAALRSALATFADWNTKTGQGGAEAIRAWVERDPAERLETIGDFYGTILTKKGDPLANVVKRDPNHSADMERVIPSIARVKGLLALVDLAELLTPALEVGRKFALLWDAAKAREGYIDFDDQISRAAQLLGNADMADWIRYKLDRQFDHILIDEAQDTNAQQWDIIFALIGDYFAGAGARDNKLRTLFTVGDYKQAIFGFQGTSPENFEAARKRVEAEMGAAADNADALRSNIPARRLQKYALGQSFRTAAPVLDFVDQAIDAIGWGKIGLKQAPEPHIGQERPGLVTLWNPVTGVSEEGDDGDEEDRWLARHDRLMADNIARQVKRWMDEGFPLVKGTKRNAGPGDVMVLVRKRKELASLIVARLYSAGVPVAGVDRLRLGNPLAVRDLMAALRFAAQPLDDLSLANLLVSPIIGWSQQDLLDHAYRDKKVGLWEHLKSSEKPLVLATMDSLKKILAQADYESPQALLHWILTGPMRGRRKLIERLGREANDPIDELLNAAHAYAADHTISLQGFIQWFDAGEGELKREAGESPDLVRVMTVHGSKGLQSPIVILADATGSPGSSPDLALEESTPGSDQTRKVPMPGLSGEQIAGPVATAKEAALAADLEEHWRLLYVAMTRAEEALFIGGSLGSREVKNGPGEDSWFARLKPLFDDNEGLEDDLWGARWELGTRAAPMPVDNPEIAKLVVALPEWVTTPIGPEPRPPRPLAPSSAGEEQAADPPLAPEVAREAARRGVLIHKLLERLPDVPTADRASRASAWLDKQAAELDPASRQEIADAAMAVLEDSEFTAIFGSDALAEVPLAATVDGQVIAGITDRLLITSEAVTVVDFKTARRPPHSLNQVPPSTIRQMSAYVAALETIYPGRAVRAALLYTQTPKMIEIPAAALATGKSQLSTKQQSFAALPVE